MIEEYRGSDRMSIMNSKILVGFVTLLKKAAKINKNIDKDQTGSKSSERRVISDEKIKKFCNQTENQK